LGRQAAVIDAKRASVRAACDNTAGEASWRESEAPKCRHLHRRQPTSGIQHRELLFPG
jgi:hypothetical protein